MDAKTKQLLATYQKQVEQLARQCYLQARAIRRELDESKINPEDRDTIKLHIISMLSQSHDLENQNQEEENDNN